MLLAIDVGNSQTVSGLYRDDQLLCHWRLKTDRRETADELAAKYSALFAMRGFKPDQVSAVIIASVVPTQQLAWRDFTTMVGWKLMMVGDPAVESGMPVLTDQPDEVGADRIVNAVAAYHHYPGALIVVDFGTAITFDCVSAAGAYLGGAIVPGINISLDALSSMTAKLPRVDISSPPRSVIGTSTVTAIKSGILNGYGSLVDGLVARLRNEMNPAPGKIIATGGMAGVIAPFAGSIDTVEPLLTLEGLRLLHERNI